MFHRLTRAAAGLVLAAGLATGLVSVGQAGQADEKAFLIENAKDAGVVTLDSGLQYKILKQGDGSTPSASDTVKVHYVGTTIDGVTFDSSYKRNKPAEFPLNRVIAGWTEGFQYLKEGTKAQLFIPAELAYGTPPVCGHPELCGKTLVFDVHLLEVK